MPGADQRVEERAVEIIRQKKAAAAGKK